MELDITKSLDIIETLDNFISSVRPAPEIRSQLDLNYEIKGQSVTLNEIRPGWNSPEEVLTIGYAKATYVKKQNVWKVFWKRADNKWHAYKPQPTVKALTDFLTLVNQDEYGCFKG